MTLSNPMQQRHVTTLDQLSPVTPSPAHASGTPPAVSSPPAASSSGAAPAPAVKLVPVTRVISRAVNLNGTTGTLTTTQTQVEDHTNMRLVVTDDHPESTGRWQGMLPVVVATKNSGSAA